MSEETANQQSCGGKKLAMLAYVEDVCATVVSAVALAAIDVGLCAVKSRRAACSTAALQLLWLRAALNLNPFATAMAAEMQDQPLPRVVANTLG